MNSPPQDDPQERVVQYNEYEDYIEPDIENYYPYFCPASVWQYQPGAEGAHPAENEASQEMKLPTMSPIQLAAYHRICDLFRNKLRPEIPSDTNYWAWPYKLAGRVAVLTGCAGSGKSTVVKWLQATMPNNVTLTATTGSAALLIGGATVDRLFCFKRQPWVPMVGLLSKSMDACPPNIVIDEASMIGEKMAGILSAILREYETKNILLVGDWAQARPVKDNWPFRSELFRAAELIRLTECHRQSNPEYLAALNEVRRGGHTSYFVQFNRQPEDENLIKVFATNKQADEVNATHYQRLRKEDPGAKEATYHCWLEEYVPENRTWAEVYTTGPKEAKLFEDSNFANELKLCIGARVLITRNHPELAYVNGDTGIVSSIEKVDGDTRTLVRLDRNQVEVEVIRATAEVLDPAKSKKPTLRVVGYPLRLGYAVTIHKTQGMTLPKLYGDLSSIFKHRRGLDASGMHGLAYVLLSRTRNPEDLYLSGAQARVEYCDPLTHNIV